MSEPRKQAARALALALRDLSLYLQAIEILDRRLRAAVIQEFTEAVDALLRARNSAVVSALACAWVVGYDAGITPDRSGVVVVHIALRKAGQVRFPIKVWEGQPEEYNLLGQQRHLAAWQEAHGIEMDPEVRRMLETQDPRLLLEEGPG